MKYLALSFILAFSVSVFGQEEDQLTVDHLFKIMEEGSPEDVDRDWDTDELFEDLRYAHIWTPFVSGGIEFKNGTLWQIEGDDEFKNIQVFHKPGLGTVIRFYDNNGFTKELFNEIKRRADSLEVRDGLVADYDRPAAPGTPPGLAPAKPCDFTRFYVDSLVIVYCDDYNNESFMVYDGREYSTFFATFEGELKKAFQDSEADNDSLAEPQQGESFSIQDSSMSPPYYDQCESFEGDMQFVCTQRQMMQQVSGEFQFPRRAREAGEGGKVYINFIIGREGEIEDLSIERTSGRDDIDAEALRTISQLENLNPARMGERAVRMSYTIPINARLR